MRSQPALSATSLAVAMALGSPVLAAQWVRVGTPLSAPITAIDATASTLFAATAGAGLFVSRDQGLWAALTNGLSSPNVTAVVRSAHLPNCLLAGTFGGAGMFQSWDNGASWWLSNIGLLNPTVRVMIAVPDSYLGTVYLAGTDTGAFRAQALGVFWRPINTGLGNRAVRAFTAYYEGSDENDGLGAHDVLAGTHGGGVFHSDMGTSWYPKNAGLTNLFVTALASSSSYAVTFAGTAGGGVFRSLSTYGAWTAINDGLPNLMVKALATSGTKLFAGTAGGGVFVANDDGFGAWSEANLGLTELTVNVLATDGSYLYAAAGSGLFRRPLSEL